MKLKRERLNYNMHSRDLLIRFMHITYLQGIVIANKSKGERLFIVLDQVSLELSLLVPCSCRLDHPTALHDLFIV